MNYSQRQNLKRMREFWRKILKPKLNNWINNLVSRNRQCSHSYTRHCLLFLKICSILAVEGISDGKLKLPEVLFSKKFSAHTCVFSWRKFPRKTLLHSSNRISACAQSNVFNSPSIYGHAWNNALRNIISSNSVHSSAIVRGEGAWRGRQKIYDFSLSLPSSAAADHPSVTHVINFVSLFFCALEFLASINLVSDFHRKRNNNNIVEIVLTDAIKFCDLWNIELFEKNE